MSENKGCPFCGVGLESLKEGGYIHPIKGCFLDGVIVEESWLGRWNTRKPMNMILKRLEEQAKAYNRKALEYRFKNVELSRQYSDRAVAYEHAIEIVKDGI